MSMSPEGARRCRDAHNPITVNSLSGDPLQVRPCYVLQPAAIHPSDAVRGAAGIRTSTVQALLTVTRDSGTAAL